MESHDFIYFYRDDEYHSVPILTGSSKYYDDVVFMSRELKKNLLRDKLVSKNKDIYVFVDGKVFRVCKAEKH